MTETETVVGVRYLTTFTGIFKLCQEVTNFAGIISVAVSLTSGVADAFLACGTIAFVMTAVLIIVNVGNLTSKIALPWTMVEFFYCLFCIVFYIIVSPLVVRYDFKDGYDGYVAGAAFGFLSVFMYGADALIKFKYM